MQILPIGLLGLLARTLPKPHLLHGEGDNLPRDLFRGGAFRMVGQGVDHRILEWSGKTSDGSRLAPATVATVLMNRLRETSGNAMAPPDEASRGLWKIVVDSELTAEYRILKMQWLSG